MREPSEFIEPLGAIFDELGAAWTVIGALAAGRYRATPRMTTDADFLVERVPGLVERLTAEGFDVRVMSAHGEEPHVLFVRGDGMKADILLPVVEYQELAIARSERHFLTVEDVIVHKLIAWRPRDRDDIASILQTGRSFDRSYVEHWATEWDVHDRWDQIK